MRFSLVFLFVFLFFQCGEKDVPNQTIFRYNEHSGITSLDPLYARNLANIWATEQLYEGLTRLNKEGKVLPSLAVSWTSDASQKHWQFRLREQVRWHPHPALAEGACLRAEDAVASLQRAANHPFTSWMFDGLVRIWVSDSLEFHLLFQEAKPLLPALLSMPSLSLLPEAILERPDLRSNPSGTGPFYLIAWHEEEKMVMRRFEDYWMHFSDREVSGIEGISISFVKDLQTAQLDFLLGRLDLLQGTAPALNQNLTERMEKGADFRVQKSPYLNIEYIAFRSGSSHPVCQNKWLRQALDLALNKALMVQEVRGGIGYLAHLGFCPPVLRDSGYLFLNQRQETVNELVRKAGFAKAADVPEWVLHTDPAYAAFTTAVVGQWRAAGFRVRSELMDRSSLKAAVAQGQLDCFRASWIADYPDAMNFLGLFHSALAAPYGPNYSQFKNDSMDFWIETAAGMPPGEAREEQMRQMERMLHLEMPVIPLYYDVSMHFLQPWVEGMAFDPMNNLNLRDVYFSTYER